MKQVWSISVVLAFALLEARVEYANYLAAAAAKPVMSPFWHVAWIALDLSAALVVGTIVAFGVDAAGEYADDASRRAAIRRAQTPK